jgi:hypothetical protein
MKIQTLINKKILQNFEVFFYLLKANFNLFNLSLSISFLSKEKLVAQPHLPFTFGEINKYLSLLECSELSVFGNIFAQSKFSLSLF